MSQQGKMYIKILKNICYAENSKIINWCMTKINDIFINNVATNIEISIDNDLEP